jgi:archaemetzincin
VTAVASLADPVGVWSISRFGEPGANSEAFRLALRRTLKTATHETGHMFSMQHCTFYECSMCGSINLEEADRHPLWLFPPCLAKLCYVSSAFSCTESVNLYHTPGISRYRTRAAYSLYPCSSL